MATELATAYVSLVPSLKGAQSAISKEFGGVSTELGKQGDAAGKGFGGGLVNAAKKFAGPLALAFGAIKVKDFLGDAIGEARESQKVGALTESIIKSTGGAAQISAKQVGDLASSLSAKAGMDDELIQTGANLLLTFKNVRNEAGKGNDVFNQATAAAVDLSAAGFGSVDSASKMLGKALNDPLAGITALGRAGVTFSDEQKKMIEGMVESGDLLGAQKIILGEVQSQVGGAAEASATAGEKLSVAWGNFKETIGTALLPIIDKLATFVAEKLLPGLLDLGPILGSIGGYAKPVIDFFRNLSSGSGDGSARMGEFRDTVTRVWASVQSIFSSAVTIITNLWRLFGDNIVGYLKGAWASVQQVLSGAFTLIQGIFNVFAGLLSGDWSQLWEGIKQILSGAWSIITGLVSAAWNTVQFVFSNAGVILGQIFSGIWSGIQNLASAGLNAVVDLIKSVPGRIISLGGMMLDAGKSLIGKLFEGLGNVGSIVVDLGKKVANGLIGAINTAIQAVNDAVPNSINMPSPVPDIPLPDNPIPKIPELYTGGLVRGSKHGMLAIIGDRYQDEAVIPTGGRYAPDLPTGGGGPQITVNPSAPLDEVELAELLMQKLQFAAAGTGDG